MAAPTGGSKTRLLEGLQAIAADPRRCIHAVIDGALLDNLPQRLEKADLRHRALVKTSAGRDLVMTGPWLIDPAWAPVRQEPSRARSDEGDLSDKALEERANAMAMEAKKAHDGGNDAAFAEFEPDRWRPADPAPRLETILQLVGPVSGVVFWTGDESLTADRLFAHLRGLGQVLVPVQADQPSERSVRAGDQGDGMELAQFRHADANVLAQLVPHLNPAQQARLLGPAEAVIFLPSDHWQGDLERSPIKRLRRLPDATPADTGLLRIEPHQYALMSQTRLQESRRKVAYYLREVDSANDALNDDELMRRVLRSEMVGRELGLKSERAHMKWAYLMSVTDGSIAEAPAVKRHFRQSPKHPDDAVGDLLRRLDDRTSKNWASIFAGTF